MILQNDVSGGKEESKKVCLPYCIFNFSYEHHSYIPKGSVVAFAENEDGEENEVFEVEEISGKEEYRNWVPKKKGFLPTPPKLDFLCSPAEVSAHRKLKLEANQFQKTQHKGAKNFVNTLQKSSQRIAKTLEEQTLLLWILTLVITHQYVKSLIH